MKECSKSISRRLSNPNFSRFYFRGNGIDIGGKPDPLSLYAELFPLINSVRVWDIDDGDAQYLTGVNEGHYDFVHSSHCLEHLVDPKMGLENWFRVIKPGGYLIVTVPDEDLYEQGVFPSSFNKDHKWTFTIYKEESWNDKSINILTLLQSLGHEAAIEKVELLNSSYRYEMPRFDQTLTPVGECGIEIIVRKRIKNELESFGCGRDSIKISREFRIHLNQYKDDLETLKQANVSKSPFENDSEL